MTTKDHRQIDSELSHISKVLKAPRIRATYFETAEQAREDGWSFEEYLAAVLSVEASARQESGANARIKRAGFPRRRRLKNSISPSSPASTEQRLRA